MIFNDFPLIFSDRLLGKSWKTSSEERLRRTKLEPQQFFHVLGGGVLEASWKDFGCCQNVSQTPKGGSCWKLGHKAPQDGAMRDCVQAVLDHKTQKLAPRCSEDVYKTPKDGLRWKLRWASAASERAKRSEQSDQDGLGELPRESCSKDAFRVREGRRRKAIQHAYVRQTCLVWLARVPARFHLQRASRSYVNTRFMLGVFLRAQKVKKSVVFISFWLFFEVYVEVKFKRLPRRFKRRPRRLQDGRRWRPRRPQEASKSAQDAHESDFWSIFG